VAHGLRGDGIAHATVDQDMLADPERREDPRRREARAHRVAQLTVGDLDARAGCDIRRDRPEWDLEVGERSPLDGAERLEDALKVLAREEPRAREVEIDPEVGQARQDLHEILDVPDAR